MDTPEENPEGYESGAVLTWIDRYKGGLRLTHGTIDDNVHMQQTMQVGDWLTSHDKPFELMIYPDSRHGIQTSQRAHLNRESHDFWVRNLLGGKLPDVVVGDRDAETGEDREEARQGQRARTYRPRRGLLAALWTVWAWRDDATQARQRRRDACCWRTGVGELKAG